MLYTSQVFFPLLNVVWSELTLAVCSM